ncbi:hypothetical protein K469DRAFT_690384 [Zopfia rhizophila CBS 207.26]|uniref:Uncharacterized protein n=1 Tax=Zopfia rhizophila CBS 207.26 TaxID=1314779 RepID=A0A6A6DY74_9PEZI|nr:hypothetical protein K469DRAFT_690384 [Zopfia rhizophila CBS 207.26]
MPGIHSFVRRLVEDELSYNLSRKYPYSKWFKLYVLLGSVVVLSSFTLFNLATNGFDKQLSIYLRRADMAKPDKVYRWWSWMDNSADAVARCDIVNNEGFFALELLVKYDTMVEYYGYIAVNNATTHASFWWGARLLNAYFVGTKYVMSGQLPDSKDTPISTRGTLGYHNKDTTTSMKDSKLFDSWFLFLDSGGGVSNSENTKPDNGEFYNNPSFSTSRPLTEGFFFAKIFRSLILVDLGNSIAPNLLLDPDLLQCALNPADDDFNRTPGAPLRNTTTRD